MPRRQLSLSAQLRAARYRAVVEARWLRELSTRRRFEPVTPYGSSRLGPRYRKVTSRTLS
jgi:hypothetical protein